MKAFKNIICRNYKRYPFVLMLVIISFLFGFTTNIFWEKDSVVPVVLVEPGIGGFHPTEGTSIGNTCPKSEVMPVCLTKTSIGGYVPFEGSSIGNTWSKSDVMPVCLVKQSGSSFLPLVIEEGLKINNEKSPDNEQNQNPALIISTISEIIEDSFGDNIFKLSNGQYWKQDSYAYIYSTYRFNKVYIFKIGYKYKMKIEDENELIEVFRIK